METFGKFLAAKGVLSKEQLGEATEYLVVVGGRLGTNLVDLGLLDIEELDRLLSEYRGLSLPPAPWLQQPDPDALRCVPLRVVQRHSVFDAVRTPGPPDGITLVWNWTTKSASVFTLRSGSC